jgi:hypothetical protein
MLEASILQGNGETAVAISPDIAEQGLRFGVSIPAPHGEEARSAVSNHEAPPVPFILETALSRLLKDEV